MAKFDYPSRYYADDKDVSDLLSEPKFNQKALLRIARGRGIVISSELSRDSIIEYVSQLPFSWQELIKLIKSIETEEKEDHTAPVKIESEATLEQFCDAIKEVQQLRGQANSEVYTVNQSADGAVIFVKYRELDHRSTRTLQWTDHTLEIQSRKTPTGFEMRFAATDRGQEIVTKIVEKLPKGKTPVKVEAINLGAITDSAKRTQFFKSLVYGVKGFRPENVTDVRLNKITIDITGNTKIETEDLSLNGESDEDGKDQDLPAAVKRTTLYGDSLFQAPQFHDFCKQGFFVSKVLWTAIENDATARKFELEAEFKNADTGSGFSYRVRGMWSRDEDGVLELRKSAIGLVDRHALSDRIESAAYNALAEVSVKSGEAKVLKASV